MARYSRTEKYEDLRNQLQSDVEDDISSKDLSHYEQRLNRISSNNFEAPKNVDFDNHDPIHARRREVISEPRQQAEPSPFNTNFYPSNNNTSTFNNEYLNEYIKEVKQYNVEQGNAYSTNTDLDILSSLRGERPAPTKPYPDEVKVEPKQYVTPFMPASTPNEKTTTMDIPFFQNDNDDFIEDGAKTQTLSKEDIAAEVQSLIRDQDDSTPTFTQNTPVSATRPTGTSDIIEQTTRQQILNETTQMRAQLDDYEDNLTEVNDRMQKTNNILNIVLIMLIVVLFIVLGIVIYWILLSRGIAK